MASSRFSIASSRPTGVSGTSSGQAACNPFNRLLRRLAQAVERFLLLARRVYHGLDPLDRQLRQAGLRLAAALGLSIRFLLRLLLRTLARRSGRAR